MTLISGIEVPLDGIADVCKRYRVKELAVFGSAVRGCLGRDSDIDILVEFEPDARVGIFKFASLAEELERLFGRTVDLVTKPGLKAWVRPNVLREARVVFAA
jgi:uncharacterized protein